ncbi:MAG: glycoside hydrolase family 20 zincin-like fold domain-containing protein [Planctomycetota bacterium]
MGNTLTVSRAAIAVSFCVALFNGCAHHMGQTRHSRELDLADAVIVVASSDTVQAKAADMLSDEIARRTGIRLEITDSMPNPGASAIVLGRGDTVKPTLSPPEGLKLPTKAEGYAIWAANNKVYLVGRDDRGSLFAAGRLIRLLTMSKDRIGVPPDLRLASAPEFPIRGHQLGYRNLNNTYDTWDLATYEQYLRDLIIFGTNAIELVPTLNPDRKPGPHMEKSMWQMNEALSEMIGSYGLDVWMWVKVMYKDVNTPEAEQQGLAKRRRLFESLPHLDAVFVPGGDGGDTPVEVLMPWLGRLAEVLRDVHPNATLWVSNQTYEAKDNDFFFNYLQTQSPDWLEGVVYGPWTTVSIPEVRRRTPKRYKLRRYPDICHCLGCQYPVPQWDRTFSQTFGREPICPRPRSMTHIHNLYATFADGFITYSDGATDDLNKFVWSALGWDSKTGIETIVHEYAKTFFGDRCADDAARGLLKLEDDWLGPVAENKGIDQTLKIWQDIAQRGGDELADNWRLQMYLCRAYYDSYLKHRSAAESSYQAIAYEALKRAPQMGVKEAIDKARSELARVDTEKPAQRSVGRGII